MGGIKSTKAVKKHWGINMLSPQVIHGIRNTQTSIILELGPWELKKPVPYGFSYVDGLRGAILEREKQKEDSVICSSLRFTLSCEGCLHVQPPMESRGCPLPFRLFSTWMLSYLNRWITLKATLWLNVLSDSQPASLSPFPLPVSVLHMDSYYLLSGKFLFLFSSLRQIVASYITKL